MKKFLIVAAHPDDEVLGCGATAKKLVNEGWIGATLILGEGVRSRGLEGQESELLKLKNELLTANKILGIEEVFVKDFPDNAFDSVALLEIVKAIEEVKAQFQPDIIFTHSEKDLNIDHQITNRAVATATRPMESECVKEVYTFEVLSSSEWSFKEPFTPDTFMDVTSTIESKKEAMLAYQNEIRKYPHPRSVEGIEIQARNRGLAIEKEYAEAFSTLRRKIDTFNI